MADQQTYTTVVHDHGWWCDCPAASAGHPDDRGLTVQEAVEDADHHVGYESDVWPHTVVDITTDRVWPDKVAEEWCADEAAQERAELLALTADEDTDDDVDGDG